MFTALFVIIYSKFLLPTNSLMFLEVCPARLDPSKRIKDAKLSYVEAPFVECQTNRN